MKPSLTRRQWLLGSTAAAAAAGWLTQAQLAADDAGTDTARAFFGDLHNHNSIGYAKGSLERTFDVARNHLDFFAFTPHGWWPDIRHYENDLEQKWLRGFDVTRDHWPEVLAMARKYETPGTFVPIVGFEMHSLAWGDYHILFPTLDGEYFRPESLQAFQEFAKERGAILVPHHPANTEGHRGIKIDALDPAVSPVMEIFSEWGSAEHDRAPYPYIRHSEAGRWTRNTWQHYLAQGYRLGAIASTDDHLGYPGAYREGLAAVVAPELTREAIFAALRQRRTYAVSGDRILLDFRLNGRVMGQELPYTRWREIRVSVTGWDQLDRVEVLKNNRVIHRNFPMDRLEAADRWERPVLVRFEYGWGPWRALQMDRVCDWDIHLRVDCGWVEGVQPCFLTGPLDEQRRDRIISKSDHHVHLQSFTALRDQYEDSSQKAVVLKIRGGEGTRLTVGLESPSKVSLTRTLGELAASGDMLFTGPFPRESAMLHRLVFPENYQTAFTLVDEDVGQAVNWYYVRAVQANGQLAWSSPIWVERSGA